jgi:hypothetical protein
LPVDQDLLERPVHTKEEDDDYVRVIDLCQRGLVIQAIHVALGIKRQEKENNTRAISIHIIIIIHNQWVMLGKSDGLYILFSFSCPPLLFLAVYYHHYYYYAIALGDVVGPVEGEAEGLSNLSDIILYISNS